jgi:hypothetical protein
MSCQYHLFFPSKETNKDDEDEVTFEDEPEQKGSFLEFPGFALCCLSVLLEISRGKRVLNKHSAK